MKILDSKVGMMRKYNVLLEVSKCTPWVTIFARLTAFIV
jgi:hypothetical protein